VWKEREGEVRFLVDSAVSFRFGFLEGRCESTHGFIPFKENHSTSLVSRCQVVSRVVEFDGGDDVGWEKRGKQERGRRERERTVTSGD